MPILILMIIINTGSKCCELKFYSMFAYFKLGYLLLLAGGRSMTQRNPIYDLVVS